MVHILHSAFRWAASALLVFAALLAVIASLVLQFVYGNVVQVPRPAVLDLLTLFVLPVVLVGCSIYLASVWLYRGDHQLSMVVHFQHTWMLYAAMALATYSLSRCAKNCDPDSAAIYMALALGATAAVAADLVAYFKRRHALVRPAIA